MESIGLLLRADTTDRNVFVDTKERYDGCTMNKNKNTRIHLGLDMGVGSWEAGGQDMVKVKHNWAGSI